MSKGMLQVRTYISNMLIPIKGTRVTVTEDDGDGENIIAFRVTDENGKTQVMEIDTPDIEISLDRESTQKPYRNVNIKAEKDGFVIFIIKNVQVFANRLSEQNVEMIPLPEKAGYSDFSNTYVVTPQNLQR